MTKSDIRDKQICLCRRLQPRFVLGSFGVVLMSDQVFLQVLLSAACQFAVLLQFMSNLMYREDHTTDCWINLLRLPIITIVTSSLYKYIISLCNKACNKGLRIEKLAKCRYMIPMLRFRYFQVLLLPGFYSIVFSWCFYFYLKKVKIILTLGRTRGWMPPPSEVFLSFFPRGQNISTWCFQQLFVHPLRSL